MGTLYMRISQDNNLAERDNGRYNLVKDFFSNDMDLNDLYDSEAVIWIDWGEYDEDVVR